jgi:predicted DCC family thiol-disulfide oxidoreductase YuxK
MVSRLRRVVIYDGVCHLCDHTVKFIIQRDLRDEFRFCALQSRAAEPFFAEFGLTRDDALKSIIFIEGESVYQRSDAAIRIAERLPFPWWTMRVFLYVPRFLRDAIYNVVGTNRYTIFGRSDDGCLAPSASNLRRFLDADEQKAKRASESKARRAAAAAATTTVSDTGSASALAQRSDKAE